MIGDLKPYAEYKDSGLSWLGKVPRHWVVSPLASLARLKTVINQSDRQLLSVYLQRGVVRFSDVAEKRTNTTSEDLGKYQAVDPGDFVLNNQQAWRGSVGVSDFSGIVSPAYLVLALSNQYLPRYANSLFRDQSMVAQYLICSKGVGTIQRNLYWPHLKRVGVIVPPPDEQAAIVRFLDWANGRLERAIRAKRKVIALLNEQRQAIIHHAVTRGLDPSAPLKDSGIPSLGDIPQHWEVRKVREIAQVINGYPFDSRLFSLDRGHPLVRIRDINKSATSVRYQGPFIEAARVKRGEVLIGMDGDFNVGIWQGEEDALLNQRMCCVRSGSTAIDEYLRDALVRPLKEINDLTYATTVKHLASSQVERIHVGVPPSTELDGLVGFMREQRRAFGQGIARLEREITLLREYRTRLVADVVTGKLDVCKAATRLPDEELLSDLAASDDEPDDLPIEEEADA